jgi:hypothetical protein
VTTDVASPGDQADGGGDQVDGGGGQAEGGMVTAEMAAVLPVLALVTAVALWGVGAVASQVRCGDAAREAARAAARGEPSAQVRLAATGAAPAGAVVAVSAGSDGLLRVTVTARVGPLGGWLPSITVTGHAVAERETEAGG